MYAEVRWLNVHHVVSGSTHRRQTTPLAVVFVFSSCVVLVTHPLNAADIKKTKVTSSRLIATVVPQLDVVVGWVHHGFGSVGLRFD